MNTWADESMDITTFHKRGDEESSVREDNCRKTFLFVVAHPCASWRSKSNASWNRMTQREKDDELHRARVHMQFVCRMYKMQHRGKSVLPA